MRNADSPVLRLCSISNEAPIRKISEEDGPVAQRSGIWDGQTIDRAVAANSDYDIEFRIISGGTVKYVQSVGHPVLDASGNLVQFVGSTTDITERKLAEDLEEARQTASRVVKDATRAAEIITRIRLLFKRGTPERELVDVNEVIREMIVLLSSEATRYAISVRTELAQDLPQVMADRVQLQQVLMNLMINGIDAMKDVDGVRELTINARWPEEEQVSMSVSDTGVGLPPQQADQTTVPVVRKAGLQYQPLQRGGLFRPS